MNSTGIYDFTASRIDSSGHQYFIGMLEPERLDNHGMRVGKAFSVDLYHNAQKSELYTFDWICGAPHNWKLVASFKGEIFCESEVPGLLKEYNLI